MKSLFLLLFSLLAGCSGVQRAPMLDPAPLFRDAAFGPPSVPVGTDDLFTLSPEMQAHLRSPAFMSKLRDRGYQRGLVDALYAKGELKLEYEASMTRTAAQAYAARAGNCLSLVIMTAAFARELGMQVHFQSVDTEEVWGRSGGLYVVSNHVNLSLGHRALGMGNDFDDGRTLTIDFLPPEDASRYRSHALDEADIVMMFMNNRAAEALVQGRIDDAYWWARGAVAQRTGSTLPYNTLAVVYQRHGDNALSERVLRAALEREPENLVVMQNLVPVLAALGKAGEAEALARRIASIEPHPPFQFFDEGMKALHAGDPRAAKALFAREVKRAPYYDEFHFWLAIACLRLGEQAQAREQLALAVEHSTRRDTRDLYSAKLAYLRSAHRGIN